MSLAFFTSLVATGFMVAFLHAALPTHWLPFVLVGTGQRWTHRKTMTIAAAAALGHITLTIGLGVLLMGASLGAQAAFGAVFPRIVGGVLIALGLFYLLHGPGHVHRDRSKPYTTDRAAIIGLISLLTLSPCEAFLPIYVANVTHGWAGFAVLSGVLAVASILGMLLFTGMSLAGARRLKLERLARYESTILGVILCCLGVAVMVLKL